MLINIHAAKCIGIDAHAVDIALEKAQSQNRERDLTHGLQGKAPPQNREVASLPLALPDPLGLSEIVGLFHGVFLQKSNRSDKIVPYKHLSVNIRAYIC